MENLNHLFHYLLHIDIYLINFVASFGLWTYVALFTIIFCETGLIILPFLPGDSLLFAAGSIAANENSLLNIGILFILLTLASIIGNKVNYFVGKKIGPKVFIATESRWFNKKYLEQTHQFYEKHGGKTIIFARFIPIIRTFAPFVAGVGYMSDRSFGIFNIASALLWIGSLLGLGYFLGSLTFVKENFSLFIYGIIFITILPPIFALIYKKNSDSLNKMQ